MTIKEIINNTKKCTFEVAVKNQNELSFMGNPVEIYFGKLIDISDEYLNLEVTEINKICMSTDENRTGAHVLVVKK